MADISKLPRVRWAFDDSPTWEAWDTGTFWNGWPNLILDQVARDKMLAWLRSDPDGREDECVTEFAALKPDADGHYDLSGHGWTPNILD